MVASSNCLGVYMKPHHIETSVVVGIAASVGITTSIYALPHSYMRLSESSHRILMVVGRANQHITSISIATFLACHSLYRSAFNIYSVISIASHFLYRSAFNVCLFTTAVMAVLILCSGFQMGISWGTDTPN